VSRTHANGRNEKEFFSLGAANSLKRLVSKKKKSFGFVAPALVFVALGLVFVALGLEKVAPGSDSRPAF
jgi:hypothetical protein